MLKKTLYHKKKHFITDFAPNLAKFWANLAQKTLYYKDKGVSVG